MAQIIINLDPKEHKEFKKGCTDQGISMTKRLVEHIRRDIASWKKKEAEKK